MSSFDLVYLSFECKRLGKAQINIHYYCCYHGIFQRYRDHHTNWKKNYSYTVWDFPFCTEVATRMTRRRTATVLS